MAAIFCVPTMGGLRGYKIWQPHFVSPLYSVSPQFRGVIGGGKIANTAGEELSCHCLG